MAWTQFTSSLSICPLTRQHLESALLLSRLPPLLLPPPPQHLYQTLPKALSPIRPQPPLSSLSCPCSELSKDPHTHQYQEVFLMGDGGSRFRSLAAHCMLIDIRNFTPKPPEGGGTSLLAPPKGSRDLIKPQREVLAQMVTELTLSHRTYLVPSQEDCPCVGDPRHASSLHIQTA